MTEERRIEFKGTALQGLGWGLLATVATILVIPAAWGAAALYRWLVRNLSFSDGTQASFEGRGGEVWGYFVIAMLLGFVPELSRVVEEPSTRVFVWIGLGILTLPISVAVSLKIIRWFFSRIRLSCGTGLNFKGTYGAYLGWAVLVVLSIFTIIGWAWASVAMLRWMCRNIEGGENQIVFNGNGWGLLWRAFLASLASIFIIPAPWMCVWIIRWFCGNMVIKQTSINIV
jgi:hypothetical protein